MLEIVVVVIESMKRQIGIGLRSHEVHLCRGPGLAALHLFNEVGSWLVCSFISSFVEGFSRVYLQSESCDLRADLAATVTPANRVSVDACEYILARSFIPSLLLTPAY